MARIRTIKPEFCQSESVGRLSRDARLLFVQLWTICDDEGKCRGNDRILSSLLYPFDDDAINQMPQWLSELDREGCIVRYKVEGNTFLQVCKWLSHQKIDRPSPSRIPNASEGTREFDASSRGSDVNHHASDADLGPRTVVPGTIDLGPRKKHSRVKAAGDVDARHTLFKIEFMDYVKNATGLEADWTAREGTALKKYLAGTPKMTVEHWKQILGNRSRSEVAHGEALSAWIGKAKTFYNHPLDRFGKPLGGKTNGTARTAEIFDVNAGIRAEWAAEELGIGSHHGGRTIEAGSASSERPGAQDAGGLVLRSTR